MSKKILSEEQKQKLLQILEARFEQHMDRHPKMEWSKVREKLEAQDDKLWSLNEMEQTGGEPDIVAVENETGAYIFFDCSPESPKGRRSICYDREALESRKKYPPEHNAIDMAADMGIEILNEAQYNHLQQLGDFDTKTSSWIHTPSGVRELGGALFADFRYGRVFVYHNSAPSYYAARGFRALLKV